MAKRGGMRRPEKARRGQGTPAGYGPEVPPELAMVAWLLDPERREATRRRFIDGKGGSLEGRLYKYAHSRPPASDHGFIGLQFMTAEQCFSGEGDKRLGEKYLNLPPGVVDPSKRPQAAPQNSSEDIAQRLHREAWALVHDPEYVDALERRIDDGKASQMAALHLEIAVQKAREPQKWRPRRPFRFLSEHPPGLIDPLAERERTMIAAREAQDQLEARARQEARDPQAAGATVAPEDPSDPDSPVLYSEES